MSRCRTTARITVATICSALALIGTLGAENNRWIPGYSSPGFGAFGNTVGKWNANGFVMVPGVTSCLEVPGPDGTFEDALLWIWNGSFWEYTGSGCLPVFSVRAVEQRGSDIYIGGSFLTIDGLPIKYLARWNGQEWSAPWSEQLDGWVNTLAYDGSQFMYVGGSFSHYGIMEMGKIGRLDGFDWEPLFDVGGGAQGTDGAVNAVKVSSSGIVAAGDFEIAGGETSVGNVAKWEPSGPFGAWSEFDGGLSSGVVNDLAVSEAEIWISGGFNDTNIPAKQIAYFDLQGGGWQSPGDPDLMDIFAIQDVELTGGGRLFSQGDFTGHGDPNTKRLAEWTGTTWVKPTNMEQAYDPTGIHENGSADALVAHASDVFFFDRRVAPAEFELPVFHGGITRFDGTNWHGLGQGIGDWGLDGQNDYVSVVHEFGGEIFVGGSFPNAGDALHEGLARWQGDDWASAGETLTTLGTVVVRDLATYQGNLVMGGCFESSGATVLNSIGRWNGSQWEALGGGIVAPFCFVGVPGDVDNDGVQALLPMGSDLYVGGRFSGAGVPGDNLVMWNGASWSEVGGGTLGTVAALAELGGDLYVAGTITRGNTPVQVVKRVAKWNGAAWDDLDGGMDGGTPQYEGVFALATIGSDLFAAGDFTTAGGVAASNIARWDGTDWNPLGAGVDGLVLGLEVVGTDLYATGQFTEAGGQVARGIAKWDGSVWTPLGYGLNSSGLLGSGIGTGFDLLFQAGTARSDGRPAGEPTGNLYVGGYFTFTGDKLSNNFGIYQLGEIIDFVFTDGFESGGTSEWSNTVP